MIWSVCSFSFFHYFRLLACGLLLSFSGQSASAGWKQVRESLDQRHVASVFRIHYTRTGVNALPGDAEAVSRQVLRLAEQFERAHRFYSETMGLASPLLNLRYPMVGLIDVHVISMRGKKGSAGDEPVVYRYRLFDDFVPALSISISSLWLPGNLTPEHEVFHAYQYGYTFFKNSWFLEGLARAMEGAFREPGFDDTPLPQEAFALGWLLDQSYAAAPFWHRLMRLCAPDCQLQALGGKAERAASEICGARFVKRFLSDLSAMNEVAAVARGINPRDWPEDEQRSPRNNPWLLKSLARSIGKQCPVGSNAEIARFLDVLNAYR